MISCSAAARLAAALTAFAALATAATPSNSAANSIPQDKLVMYTAVMHTYWTRDRFPKHYPDWSPTAQFSQLVGGTHDKTRWLYRVGEKASPEMREFAETGHWSGWPQTGPGVLDTFTGQSIASGQGRTEVHFFMNPNHTLVSLMARIIPSPDWFIGLDSFQLCVDGNWLDTITIEVDPLDAGTDNGFTFTAAKWVTEPQGVVYRITSRYPAHPAGSFYYPYLKRLPPIATFQFIKMREYEVSQVLNHLEDDKRYEMVKSEQDGTGSNPAQGQYRDSNQDIEEEIEEETKEQEMKLLSQQSTMIHHTIDTTETSLKTVNDFLDFKMPSKGSESLYKNHQHPISHFSSNKLRKSRVRECRVSEWSPWSECRTDCGVTTRRRTVLSSSRRSICPPLRQTRWCGSTDSISSKTQDTKDCPS